MCSGCGRKLEAAHDAREREVRDLPCMEFRTTVVVEVYRVCCPDCGIKVERVPQLPSKAPFSKRFVATGSRFPLESKAGGWLPWEAGMKIFAVERSHSRSVRARKSRPLGGILERPGKLDALTLPPVVE